MTESKAVYFLAADRFVSIPFELMMDKDSKGNDLLSYLAISSFADKETGIAWPKTDKIAERAKKSKKVIIGAIKHLENIKWATKIRRGQGKVNIIILHARKEQDFSKAEKEKIKQDVEQKVYIRYGGV